MDPLALAAALSVMVTVFALLIAFYAFSGAGHNKRVISRLEHVVNRTPLEGFSDVSALRQTRMGLFPYISSLFAGKEWASNVTADIESADLKLRVAEYLSLRIACALVLFTIAIYVAGRGVIGLLLGVVAAFVGYTLPKFYIKRRLAKRLMKFDDQLVEALSLVANALRSGFGLLQSMDLAAEQLKDPLAIEFKRTITDINVGASFEDALLALNERMHSPDLDIAVTAILIQRTVGGNLGEILDTVAHTMRERSRIKGELRTLTAQQKMSGYIVGGLPIAIIGVLLVLGQLTGDTYVQTLFTTNPGRVALLAAAGLEFTGAMIIRKILAIEV
jgi:tight adherence protein B